MSDRREKVIKENNSKPTRFSKRLNPAKSTCNNTLIPSDDEGSVISMRVPQQSLDDRVCREDNIAVPAVEPTSDDEVMLVLVKFMDQMSSRITASEERMNRQWQEIKKQLPSELVRSPAESDSFTSRDYLHRSNQSIYSGRRLPVEE